METEPRSVDAPDRLSRSTGYTVRLLGKVDLIHCGAPRRLPRSRKVKALLGYLAMSPKPVLRSRLCDLLWDRVSDPRAELRWALSKLRRIFGEHSSAVVAEGDWVSFDRAAVTVDALQFLDLVARLNPTATIAELNAADAQYAGEFFGDLQGSLPPRFDAWLTGQRAMLAAEHRSVLERMVAALGLTAPARMQALRRLIACWQFDDGAHIALLRSLVACREIGEAKRHLEATRRAYREEGINEDGLLRAWHDMRRQVAARGREASDRHPERASPDAPPDGRIPLIAVAPFGAGDPDAQVVANSLAHDVTVGIARLRSPFVLAPSSALALADRGLSLTEIARSVRADYALAGEIARIGPKLCVDLDLMAVETDRLIWSDRIAFHHERAPEVTNDVAVRITAALAAEIEVNECHRAFQKPVATLTAWQAHHRGLWHLHRFTRADNDMAIGFFNRAASLDPVLARNFAGLSYAHWMNAFAFRPAERARELRHALDAASRGLHADPKDPAALWSMSRALWMSNDEAAASRTIDQAIDLSPSFALARHSRSFCECQTGDPKRAIEDSRIAERLSPFDPWRYAMHGVQALANLRLGNRAEAVEAALSLTSMPNAHVQARGLAALVMAACGELADARREIAVVRTLRPSYRLGDFFCAYHVSGDLQSLFGRVAPRIGLPS
ncbi:adenylate cyclase [Paralimibaculum aggregatum]|uniref:Adenylate cyclase n=1 Tax=Paralimibaculum aggregatum TaxID=3036245 RepID=A0ABQ6LMV5_9RHOB|nr:hypothetical protein [Limibaculum sp. NKW23]GMG84513.1 adenylate cyclase [Limibaculum sp. NKW23]